MSKPVLTVIGAIGKQGSSVVAAFQAAGTYQIRALTSNSSSQAATDLAARPNVEVRQVDLDSPESVISALEGSTLLFANTVFPWQIMIDEGPEAAEKTEASRGVNVVKAAAATKSLRHFIWSTLPDASKQTGGKHNIPHFQAKIPADNHIHGNPDLFKKTTFLRVGFYDTNIVRSPYYPALIEKPSSYMFMLPCPPETIVPFAGDEGVNVGILATAIFDQPEKTQRRIVSGLVESVTCKQWSKEVEKAARTKDPQVRVSYVNCPLEQYAEVWAPARGMEIGLMMRYFGEDKNQGWNYSAEGLDIVSPKDLGVDAQLKSVRDSLVWL